MEQTILKQITRPSRSVQQNGTRQREEGHKPRVNSRLQNNPASSQQAKNDCFYDVLDKIDCDARVRKVKIVSIYGRGRQAA